MKHPSQASFVAASRPVLRAALLILAATTLAAGHARAAATGDLALADLDALIAATPSGATDVSLGDMKFKISFLTARRDALAATPGLPAAAVLWPDGVVPYSFDASVTLEQKAKFLEACTVWSEVSSLNFVARDAQDDYIEVTAGITNEAHVGKQGGKQTLSILNWNYKFIIAHQIGHALGLAHEDTRADRDGHVSVATAAIQPAKLPAFGKLASANLTAYDFDSLLHRGRSAYSKDGQDTILPLAPDGAQIISIGQFSHLSALDIAGIQELYGFPPAGTYDPSFDSAVFLQGSVSTSATQADGKILVGGAFIANMSGQPRPNLIRLNADGSPDSTFAPLPGNTVQSISVLPDQRILVSGTFSVFNGVIKPRNAMLKPDGTLDTTFNLFGATTGLTDTQPAPRAILSDGKMIVGYPGSPCIVRRLLGNGSPDPTFTQASLVFNFGNSALNSTLVQPDGKILIAGIFSTVNGVSRFAMARLMPNGTLDTGFSATLNDGVEAMAVQRDRKILLVTGGSIRRLNADGSADASFLVTPVGTNPRIKDIRLQADGKILVAGQFEILNSVVRSHMARLHPDGSVDGSFKAVTFSEPQGYSLPQSGKPVLRGELLKIVRMENDAPLSNLTVSNTPGVPASGKIVWNTGGTFPETTGATFHLSRDGGTSWIPLGPATGDAAAWELSGLNLPSTGVVRALGGGLGAGSTPNHIGSFAHVSTNFVLGSAPRLAVETAATGALSTGDRQSLGSVQANLTADTTFTLRNTGGEELTGISAAISGSDGALFSITGEPAATLAAGATSTLTVSFSPANDGAKNATLTIASNDPLNSPFTLGLAGTGTPVPPVLLPEIVVEQPAKTDLIDGEATRFFGSVTVGRAGTPKTFVIRNTGKAPLINLSISTVRKNADDFLLPTPKIATIPAGGKTTFRVIFKPKGTGVRTATLRIKSNDADESPFDIMLTGRGTKRKKSGDQG